MTYEEAKQFLSDCNQYADIPGTGATLEPLKELLRRLGNPQDQLHFVHISGTNGKGSVLAYVSSILKEAGFKVGRYISPTIFEYRERIQVNEEYISREDLARLTERIWLTGKRMLSEGKHHPTMFEAETALAFLYFAEQKCDIVVLEVGMGGILDATNVIKNTEVAAITSISMDHMGFLGSTLAEIAEKKAGIIKPGCVVVTTRQEPEADAVIQEKAKACGCFVVAADPQEVYGKERGLESQSFDYKHRTGLEISLSGEYQFANAALALEVIDAMKAIGYEIRESEIREGLRKTRWPGRFSVIAHDPVFLVDGAHNRDAAIQLRKSIDYYLQGKRIIFICGVLADKEYDFVMEQTTPCAAEVITIMTPDNPRALSAECLAETVRKYNEHVQTAASLEEAVEKAYGLADKEDVILAFGSLSYLGALIRTVQKREK